ncbi:hypothetical protein [Aquibacillus halophilus]|nr:hypothetical protein [Aquibacillus halophilus]
MVETIVKELIKSEDQVRKAKLLYIFCDSTAHESFLDHFIELQNEGISYDMLFLDGDTSSWLGLHKVESTGSNRVIAADEYAPAPIELPREYDGVIIPEIDVDNAARIAKGLKGSVKSEIVFFAMLLNKFVIVGDDGSGIKRSDRLGLKTLTLPSGYKKLFLSLKEEMSELGIEFCRITDLTNTVVTKVKGLAQLESTTSSNPSVQVPDYGTLITANDVPSILDSGHKKGSSLHLSKRTKVSPLAKDLFREKGIELHYGNEGEA